jgi:hypothetical protein
MLLSITMTDSAPPQDLLQAPQNSNSQVSEHMYKLSFLTWGHVFADDYQVWIQYWNLCHHQIVQESIWGFLVGYCEVGHPHQQCLQQCVAGLASQVFS